MERLNERVVKKDLTYGTMIKEEGNNIGAANSKSINFTFIGETVDFYIR